MYLADRGFTMSTRASSQAHRIASLNIHKNYQSHHLPPSHISFKALRSRIHILYQLPYSTPRERNSRTEAKWHPARFQVYFSSSSPFSVSRYLCWNQHIVPASLSLGHDLPHLSPSLERTLLTTNTRHRAFQRRRFANVSQSHPSASS